MTSNNEQSQLLQSNHVSATTQQRAIADDAPITVVLATVLHNVAVKIRAMSALRLLAIAVLIALVTAGNAMQIIGLNFWLREFPAKYGSHAGSFTTLAVSGLLFGLFFLVLLVVYIVSKRPNLEFVKNRRGITLLLGIGLMDTVNSGMAIYAASYTPEVLQALFTSLMPIYTCVFSKYILSDQRKYLNPWIGVSFVLMIVGVIVASVNEFVGGGTGSHVAWSVIFFLSIPPTSLMNVWQTKYMLDYTVIKHAPSTHANLQVEKEVHTSGDADDMFSVDASSPTASGASSPRYGNQVRGEDTIVKLVMLFGDTFSQFLMIMLLLPADGLPFWGGADSVPGAWDNFSEGIQCLFNCPKNFIYCCIYSGGFVFTYVGSAYLNQYSATLCCMIGQLSSPVTALLLILIPSWNLATGSTPWYLSVIAIVLLAVGTMVYSIWEELTSDQAPDAVLSEDETSSVQQ
ncbi:transmembrane protein, putative [Bodo saltans]|uniref:Transmembrane protein, putative n=1 Tax=Bodo saltans TaxID=75058 RepID=A0A0S4J9G3_BODSA|nr:transmembrane protein, putative [Bodo saltans]|eukprot:CUG88141.1 transmembrane protein, putative [Bodo saltans]